jgi:hypothetical protein
MFRVRQNFAPIGLADRFEVRANRDTMRYETEYGAVPRDNVPA